MYVIFGSRLCRKFIGVKNMNFVFSNASTNSIKWDLLSAVCLERKPVLTRTKNDVEVDFQTLLEEFEYEKSFKADHELKKEMDSKRAELMNESELVDMDVDHTSKQTAQDFEDACLDEFNKFQLAFGFSVAEKENDVKSLERKLDHHLVLLVNQKLGSNYQWILPQGLRNDQETMRQAAERTITETCGEHLKVQFLGNAPCGFYKYRYPKEIQEKSNGSFGAKVFFFKAWYVSGIIQCKIPLLKDFKWLCRKELIANSPSGYSKSINQFLIDY